MAKSADAFRTISEVAEWLDLPTHVLRFWESKFTQVKPVKRAGGRRYYRPNDMLLLGGIKTLLHDDGMTIKGVQKVLRDQGVKHVASLSRPIDAQPTDMPADLAADNTETLETEVVEAHADTPEEQDPTADRAETIDPVESAAPKEPDTEQAGEPTEETAAEASPELAPEQAQVFEQTEEDSAAQSDLDQDEAEEDAPSDAAEPAGSPADPSGLPGFLRSSNDASEAEDTPPPSPLVADVPDDLRDDEAEVDAGLLSRLAALSPPLGLELRGKLEAAKAELDKQAPK